MGGGFTGLSAAWELVSAGHQPIVLEADAAVGGLAGGFDVSDGVSLEKFYHHWFASDQDITGLITELGLADRIVPRRSRTGMYYRSTMLRLSTPLDVLRFTPLGLWDRLRLAVLVLQARRVRDWRTLEGETAREWLTRLGGENVYRVVWEPLMRGKFGRYADRIGAVWLWNKLVLRGGSRDASGAETLLYYRGGFAELASALATQISQRGGQIETKVAVTGVLSRDGCATGVLTNRGPICADAVLLTTPLPISAQLLDGIVEDGERERLREIEYLANICLVLRLDRSLSDLYWINVNDPSFPFVGVIEHTNFEPPSSYGGERIVYLSRYLPKDDPVYSLRDDDYLDFALVHLERMFPAFRREWLRGYHVWRADFAQPVVEREHSRRLPPLRSSVSGVFLSSMAHIYPEDRGTNYAVREGRRAARAILSPHNSDSELL